MALRMHASKSVYSGMCISELVVMVAAVVSASFRNLYLSDRVKGRALGMPLNTRDCLHGRARI